MAPCVYRKDREKGQGLVEYALILVLLAFIVLAAMKLLAPIIGNVFSQISSPLSGEGGGPSVFDTSTPVPTSSPTPAWITCAVENQFCDFSGTALVRYGAGNSWFTGTYTNGVWCTNGVFGDPLVGTVKSCQIAAGSGGTTETETPTLTPTLTSTPTSTSTSTPTLTFTPTPTQTLTPTPTFTPTPNWITCANENSYCYFSGTAEVRYGALGVWTTGTFTNGVWCTNSVFGDPLYGVYKSCQYSQ
ncbi:MAG: hypothetical protein ABIF04_01565 [Chloroflexota bacterium]